MPREAPDENGSFGKIPSRSLSINECLVFCNFPFVEKTSIGIFYFILFYFLKHWNTFERLYHLARYTYGTRYVYVCCVVRAQNGLSIDAEYGAPQCGWRTRSHLKKRPMHDCKTARLHLRRAQMSRDRQHLPPRGEKAN